MATLQRKQQNFVRSTQHTCQQYFGNLADGGSFQARKSGTQQGKKRGSAKSSSSWTCSICSTENGQEIESCSTCKRPRVPPWSKFPSSTGARVGMYVKTNPAILSKPGIVGKHSQSFVDFLRHCSPPAPVFGVIVTIDYLTKSLQVVFASPTQSGDAVTDHTYAAKYPITEVGLAGSAIADGTLGESPQADCPQHITAVLSRYCRCQNAVCFRIFRLHNADQRLAAATDREEALAKVSRMPLVFICVVVIIQPVLCCLGTVPLIETEGKESRPRKTYASEGQRQHH